MRDDKALSRRDFIQRLSFIGSAGAILAACGGGEQQTGSGTAETGAATGGAQTTAEFSCTDTSGLAEAELQMRQSLQYTDDASDPAKLCKDCALWQPQMEGAQCGGCTLVKGPIHPEGSCTSWAPKQQTG